VNLVPRHGIRLKVRLSGPFGRPETAAGEWIGEALRPAASWTLALAAGQVSAVFCTVEEGCWRTEYPPIGGARQ